MAEKLTIEEMQSLASAKNGKCLSTKYVNNSTKLKWMCKERHIWDASPNKIKLGRWCPICARNRPAWNKGKVTPPEIIKKLSDSHKGQDHWTGRTHRKESIEKMSQGHKLNPTRHWLGKARPEIAESSRKHLLRLYESGTFPRQTNTLPERMVKEELIRRGLKEGEDFIHQYKLNDKFFLDFYFPKEKIVVECDGDFWHANPKKYAGKDLREAQQNTARVDKSKNAYITKLDNGTWTLIRLWESDIKKDVKIEVDKIEKQIKFWLKQND